MGLENDFRAIFDIFEFGLKEVVGTVNLCARSV